ncbi:MAG: hypothetical protein JKX72_07855 [Robiginitomaculum sp.]|nr:hypothetical protein [Robiginitomaculum sp.]
MRFLIFILTVALLSISTAQAKIPSEVIKPYKAYSAALKAGDKNEIKRTAKLAWQQAEIHMGIIKPQGIWRKTTRTP